MKVIDLRITYRYDGVLNENFNSSSFDVNEYTIFGLFYITIKKLKVKNIDQLVYKQTVIYVTKKRYDDEQDNEDDERLF